jgi:starch phosphorylase
MNKKQNSFVLPIIDHELPKFVQDQMDLDNMYEMLNKEIVPLYYKSPKKWWDLVETSMTQVSEFFDADRMADEYYEKMYK